MLKMMIGDEEVVCDKNINIKEEMLSASSSILNNCYPKSWENDKDYVSRFYYPKDYSKCTIEKLTPVIPKEYVRVEYIQTTGTQFIDTGLFPGANLQVETSIEVGSTQQDTSVFGSYLKSTGNSLGSFFHLTPYNNKWYVGGNNAEGNFGSYSPVVGTKYDILFNNADRQVIINDMSLTFPVPITGYTNTTLTISKRGSSNNARYGRFKYFYFKIYDKNTEKYIREFIPCYRKSDNKPGMYELIEGKFYGNDGTGEFTRGDIYEPYTSELLFSGIVKNTADISLNPREPKYCSIQLLSYKTLLSEGDTLDFVISNKTIVQAIGMVVDSVTKYGFVLGDINIANPDEVIGAYSTLNKTAYDVFQYLAEISGAKWQTRVIDDTTLAIDFYDPSLMPKGTTIEYNKEWAQTNNLVDLKFKYGTYDYRNKQIMISSEMFGDITYTEKFVSNGYSYEYITSERIGSVKTIIVNGATRSIANEVEKNSGIYANFYYKSGDASFSQNTSDAILEPGSVIQIEYTPIINGREIISNADEINRVSSQLGVNGVVSRYEERNDVTSSDELIKIGTTYLKYKGEAEIILTLITHNKDIYNIGEVVDFLAPIGNLSKQYMVKSKNINIISIGDGTWEVFYTYEMSSTFNAEKAINWFDNQRNKSQGNITEGSHINRNIDIENTANVIWDNLQVEEIEIDETYPSENALNSVIETIINK